MQAENLPAIFDEMGADGTCRAPYRLIQDWLASVLV